MRAALAVLTLALAALAAAPAQAAFPGANGRLVLFTCSYPLAQNWHSAFHTALADGTQLRTVRVFPEVDSAEECPWAWPRWSPDGRRIAYDAGDGFEIASPGGRDVRRYEHAQWPAFSPDGRRVAFGDWLDNGDEALMTMRLDGRGRRRLTDWVHEVAGPSWRPNGSHVVYWRYLPGEPPNDSVWIVRADGRGDRRLAVGRYPDWSPDGRRIVYTDYRDVWTMRADGGDKRRLTTHPEWVTTPRVLWSPDGRWIGFIRRRDPDTLAYELHLIRPNGRGEHTVPLPDDIRPHVLHADWQPRPRRR